MKYLDKCRPQFVRDQFILKQLKDIPNDSLILDAGCGSQRYRQYCKHLKYFSQDFGQYTTDEKQILGGVSVGGKTGYEYGKIDYLGNIWEVNEKDEFFDVILCTEVFEHIPYPIETIKEFSRLLKKGGKLILTYPSNCTRHMDPYYFYSGFSDRWAEYFLSELKFTQLDIKPVGDYYEWMFLETYKTLRNANIFEKLFILPSVIYFFVKRASLQSINTMCIGYHVVAVKS